MAKGNVELKKYIEWSPLRLRTFLACLRSGYYHYVSHEKVPIPPEYARGLMVHRRTPYFYRKDGTPKYKSAEKFANSVKGPWSFVIGSGKIQGQEIAWRHEKEPYWVQNEMMEILKTIYDFYATQVPPLLTEISFKTIFSSSQGDFCLTGKPDEIRVTNKGFAVRENKTAKRVPSKKELDYDYQFTFYTLGLAHLIARGGLEALAQDAPQMLQEEFKQQLQKMQGKSLVQIARSINLEYHDMRRGRIIPVTRRKPEHFHELFETLKDTETRIEKAGLDGLWPVDRDSCKRCLYSDVCDRDSDTILSKLQGELFSIPQPPKGRVREKQPKIKFPRRKKKKNG